MVTNKQQVHSKKKPQSNHLPKRLMQISAYIQKARDMIAEKQGYKNCLHEPRNRKSCVHTESENAILL